jgi:hypothetical protein
MQSRRNPRCAVLLALLLFVALALMAGCGPGQGKVSGRVLLDGKPLPGGLLTFQPTAGRQRAVSAVIDENGHYEATLPVGEVRIAVDNTALKPLPTERANLNALPALKLPPDVQGKIKAAAKATVPAVPQEGKLPGKYVPIPERYSKVETSGLTYEVREGSQEHDIPLSKK